MSDFLTALKQIKTRARNQMEKGAITDNYRGDRPRVVNVLNQVLATEIVCHLRYKRHYYTASGLNSEAVKSEFLEHANQEQVHADRVATRIIQLNGEPDFNPQSLASRSHSEYAEAKDLVEMIKENLFAEGIAIESYSEIVRWLGDKDPTTRRLMEEILEAEEEHAEDLKTLLQKTS
jgi:bacterioferritin